MHIAAQIVRARIITISTALLAMPYIIITVSVGLALAAVAGAEEGIEGTNGGILTSSITATNTAYALQAEENDGNSANTRFVKYDAFNNGHFTLEVPESWSGFDNPDGTVIFCNDNTDCDKSTQGLELYSFHMPAGQSSAMVFSDTLQHERDSGLFITRPHQVSDTLETFHYKWHNTDLGKDFVGIGVYIIAHNDVYVAHFATVPEETQIFQPIIERITSTWHTSYITDDGNTAAFNIGSQINHDIGCSNKVATSNLNVNPTHERFDRNCNIWLNAP